MCKEDVEAGVGGYIHPKRVSDNDAVRVRRCTIVPGQTPHPPPVHDTPLLAAPR